MKILLLLLSFLTFQLVQADVTGSISISNATVQQTGVTYTFVLQLESIISASGKITIRFPVEYNSSFTPNCKPLTGFQGS